MTIRGVGRFEMVTVSDSAIGITSTVMDDGFLPQVALIKVEDQPIRWTMDGTTPTTTVGHAAVAGDEIELISRDQVVKFRAIKSGATDAVLSVTQGVESVPMS